MPIFMKCSGFMIMDVSLLIQISFFEFALVPFLFGLTMHFENQGDLLLQGFERGRHI